MNVQNAEAVATLKVEDHSEVCMPLMALSERLVKCSINPRIWFHEAKTKLNVNYLSLPCLKFLVFHWLVMVAEWM
jgi:hypothetical protein